MAFWLVITERNRASMVGPVSRDSQAEVGVGEAFAGGGRVAVLDGRGALAEVVLREADRRLSVPPTGTARCVQNRARLVRALYTRLDRLAEPLPAAT